MIKSLREADLDSICDLLYSSTKNKNIILSINLMRLGIPEFPINYFFKYLFNRLKPKSIAIQSYSNFSNLSNRSFSRFKTPLIRELSSFSKSIFKSYPEYRILSATHSFIIFNNPSEVDRIFTSSFGSNSSFEFLLNNNFIWINIGSYLNETCTFIHYAEDKNLDSINFKERVQFPVEIIKDREEIDKTSIIYTHHRYKEEFLKSNKFNWIPVESNSSLDECKIRDSKFLLSAYPLELVFNVSNSLLKENPLSLTKKYKW